MVAAMTIETRNAFLARMQQEHADRFAGTWGWRNDPTLSAGVNSDALAASAQSFHADTTRLERMARGVE
jgi:hypothetical protein